MCLCPDSHGDQVTPPSACTQQLVRVRPGCVIGYFEATAVQIMLHTRHAVGLLPCLGCIASRSAGSGAFCASHRPISNQTMQRHPRHSDGLSGAHNSGGNAQTRLARANGASWRHGSSGAPRIHTLPCLVISGSQAAALSTSSGFHCQRRADARRLPCALDRTCRRDGPAPKTLWALGGASDCWIVVG